MNKPTIHETRVFEVETPGGAKAYEGQAYFRNEKGNLHWKAITDRYPTKALAVMALNDALLTGIWGMRI